MDATNGHIAAPIPKTRRRPDLAVDGVPKSRYQGVHWVVAAGKWRAAMMVGGRNTHVGLFDDEADAARAYAEAKARVGRGLAPARKAAVASPPADELDAARSILDALSGRPADFARRAIAIVGVMLEGTR
jgi:hypothetical protein